MNYLDQFLNMNGRLALDPAILDLEKKLQPRTEANPQREAVVSIQDSTVPAYKYTSNQGIEDFPAKAPSVYSSNVDKVGQAVFEPEMSARLDERTLAEQGKRQAEAQFLAKAGELDRPSSLRSSQEYMSRLSEQMKPTAGEFEPQKQDLLALAVASLAPALAGMAVGGDAGYIAGGRGGEASQKFYSGLREQEAKERAAMAEQKSKRMVGQSEAAKTGFQALKEAENIEFDKLKTYIDVTKQVYGERSKEYEQAVNAVNKYMEQITGKVMEAPKDLATLVDKEEGRQAEAKLQTQKDEAAKERAKIQAQTSSNKQNKPTGEMLKASNYFGSLKQGIDQYDAMIKEFGGKLPSQKNPNRFNLDFQLLTGAEGGSAAGIALQKISQISPENRKQISNEIAILDAILRPKTGAAVTVTDFVSKRNELFPMATDDANELARKKARIQQELNNLTVMMGTAQAPEQAIVKIPQASELPKPSTQSGPPAGMSFEEFKKWKKGQK